MYQTERNGNFTYSIPLANGNYDVTLKFSEIYYTAPGQRVFNVSIEGKQVISNLDIFAKAGKSRAYDVTVPVTIRDRELTIKIPSVVDKASINAILVRQVGAAAP